jgi:glycosyltransferase EpsJ
MIKGKETSLISIVVPIYNVEKFIHTILNQILSQPFDNFELILVNDGSTDSCGAICDVFKKEDRRIKVIHKKNGGLSSARNAGINVASGKYIVFIDPDDQIQPDYFKELFKSAEENKCDAVVSGYKTVPTNHVLIPQFQLDQVMNGKDFVLSAPNIHSNNDLCFVWRYIYKLDIIKKKKILFDENVFIGEDVIFNLEFLLKSKRVMATSKALYFYTINNPDSLMRVSYKPKLESSLKRQYEFRKDLSQKFGLLDYQHYRKDMAYYYVNTIYRMVIENYKRQQIKDFKKGVRKTLNFEMFAESTKEIGLFYKCRNYKEYIYYLALKFKFISIINRIEGFSS